MVTAATLPTSESAREPVRLDGREAMRWLRSRLRLRPGRTLVAIDGLPGAGKTSFADELAELLADCGTECVRISLDDYGLSADADPAEIFAFVTDVIEPLASGGSGRYRTPAVDASGQPQWACVAESAVVVVEGRSLHAAPFCTSPDQRLWNLSVWLDVPLDEADRRRSPTSEPSPRLAQLRYLRECDPAGRADLVVDNCRPHPPID